MTTPARLVMVVLNVALALLPVGADAQSAGKIPRIGYLGSSTASASPQVEAFQQGLRDLGWVEGQTVVIDYRFAEGRFDRLPSLAAELVRLKPDVIVAGPTPPALAATKATRTIPVVMSPGAGG